MTRRSMFPLVITGPEHIDCCLLNPKGALYIPLNRHLRLTLTRGWVQLAGSWFCLVSTR